MSHKNSKIRVGISCGDPNGIGLEALADALADERSLAAMIPVVFAPVPWPKRLLKTPMGEVEDAKSAKPGQINLVTFESEGFEHKPGKASKAGAVAMQSLEIAVAHGEDGGGRARDRAHQQRHHPSSGILLPPATPNTSPAKRAWWC